MYNEISNSLSSSLSSVQRNLLDFGSDDGKNIFKSKELEKNSVFQKILITASDGKKYKKNV